MKKRVLPFSFSHLGRLLLVVPTNVHARYFAVFCITNTTIGLIIAWCAYLLPTDRLDRTVID